MAKNKVTSFLESYEIIKRIAGKKIEKVNKSYLAFIISFLFQGFAYTTLYPLFDSLFKKNFVLNDTLFWFALLCVFTVIAIVFKWFALNFLY